MKKLLVMLLALALVFAFAACNATDEPAVDDTQETTETTDDTAEETQDNTADAAANAEIVIKFGHVDGATSLLDTPIHAIVECMKTSVESHSNGKMTVQEYPNAQLGGSTSLFEQNAAGTLEMSVGFSMSGLSAYVPEAMLFDIPYVFSSELTATDMLNGEWGEQLQQKIIDATGVRCYFMANAMRSFITTKKQIKTAADFQGLKLRVQDSPAMVALLDSLGASATVVDYNESYSALQTGVVDGAEQHPYGIPMASWQEVCKYYTLDKYIPNIAILAVSNSWYESLSDEDQASVDYAIKRAMLAYRGVIEANEANVFKQIQDAGVEVYTPTEEALAELKSIAQPAVIKYVASQVGQDTVDSFLKAAAEVEANRGY